MKNQNKGTLELISFDVYKCIMNRFSNEPIGQFDLKAEHVVNFFNQKEKQFYSGFFLSIKEVNTNNPFQLDIEAGGLFKIQGEEAQLDEKTLNNLLYISSPIIVYPYLRSFIANFTLNAGLKAIHIPSVDFAQQFRNRKQKD